MHNFAYLEVNTMNVDRIVAGLAQVALSAVKGFTQGLASDAGHEAWDEEMGDSGHDGENIPTHIAHTVGRFFGMAVKGISDQ